MQFPEQSCFLIGPRGTGKSTWLRDRLPDSLYLDLLDSGFSRFLESVSFSHGAQINVAAVARECEVERKVVAGYVGILEDLLLAFRLPVFRRRAKRATVVHDRRPR